MQTTWRAAARGFGVTALVVAGWSCTARTDEAMPAAPAAAPAVAVPMGLAAGEAAPDFTLPDQNNKEHHLADYRGKTVVLAFYPADSTKGCTVEAHSLTKALPDFAKRNVQVFGVSVQGVDSKKKFCDAEGITYPLLADTEKKVSQSYGVLSQRGVASRVSFVIDPQGKITSVDRSVKPATHAQDLLALLDKPTAMAEGGAVTEKKEAPAIDKPLFSFNLPNYDGKDTKVGDWGVEGRKATLILFIATKCPISNAYNERMAKLNADYSTKGVRVVGINSNKAEPAEEVAKHAGDNAFGFPVLKDAKNLIADRFEAKVTPEAYLVDSAGVLRYHGRIDDSKNAGAVTKSDLREALDAVLAGNAVTNKEVAAFGCTIKRVN